MESYPSVAVVILNFNGQFFLEKFLPSVFNSKYPNLKIVLGDNNSTDGSVAFVREYYPLIEIISNKGNFGFAGGYNAILEQVEADYYVLLNSDVEVTEDWILPVVEYLESDPQLVAAQPKIRSYHQREKFEHAGAAGGFMDRYGYPFCRGRLMNHLEDDLGQYDTNRTVFWATGAALFIRSSAWREVGGFDDDFFAHMEEIDLCWRLQLRGYKIGVCTDSTVFHVGGGTLDTSNPQKTYLNFRNNLVMLQKNLSFWNLVWVIGIRLWLDLFALIKFLAAGKAKDAWAVSRAHQYFFKNIFKTAKKRKETRSMARLAGVYPGLIVYDFFAKKIATFSSLRNISS